MNDDSLYSAFVARDARFDGVLFVGVTSTGIYCRPVCTARTPARANCRFFGNAAAAEKAGFRPCLRCRPELAPGNARVDASGRSAARIADRIAMGAPEEGDDLEGLAAELCMSSRQMRRVAQRELGVSPIELVQTRRLLLAKQLLTETSLPVTEVAYSSGFSSLRRFNDAFLRSYGMAPTRLRRQLPSPDSTDTGSPLALRLTYRAPFDWDGLLRFLGMRSLPGTERVADGSYARTVRIRGHTGWVRVTDTPQQGALRVEIARSLAPVLPALLGRLRHTFDLNAHPGVIAAHLGRDARFARALQRAPGLRVPGSFDGFELAVRAILGQQITVRAAAVMAARFTESFGDPIRVPVPGLVRLTAAPGRIAGEDEARIASLGIVRSRARAIVDVARRMADGTLRIEPGADVVETARALMSVRGIGPWTAQYIALRGLGWPDAFPKQDVVVQRRLGGVTAREADALSEAWRPWRSYATLHLWRGLD